MRLAILMLLALTTSGLADGPSSKPATKATAAAMVAAERAWRAAEQERDPRAATALWEAAAIAFDTAVATAGPAAGEAAYAAVLAWKNALRVEPAITPPPREAETATPLSKRDTALVHSLDVYLRYAPAGERPEALFLRANTLRRHGHLAESTPTFIEIVTMYPEHEVAEYAANLLLDGLNLQGKHGELVAWVATLRASPTLLKKRPELKELLGRLDVQILRKRAEGEEAAGSFLRCATTYLEAVKDSRSIDRRSDDRRSDDRRSDDRHDELLFNAGRCFERGGATRDALKAFEAVAKLRGSALAAKAKARAAALRP